MTIKAHVENSVLPSEAMAVLKWRGCKARDFGGWVTRESSLASTVLSREYRSTQVVPKGQGMLNLGQKAVSLVLSDRIFKSKEWKYLS